MTNSLSLTALVEALLLASGEPVRISEMARVLGRSAAEVRDALQQLEEDYSRQSRGLVLLWLEDRVQLGTHPGAAEAVSALLGNQARNSLSRAALETLAVVAYRQPVTRQEIESIRGVKADRVVSTLLDKGVIREVGRKAVPGRPALFGTTDLFLRTFGLRSLEELPEVGREARTRETADPVQRGEV